MNEYQIEKGVPPPPMPQPKNEGLDAGRSDFPFDQMEVGDSFTVPMRRAMPFQLSNTARAWARRNDVKRPRRFIARMEGNRVRLWRVA